MRLPLAAASVCISLTVRGVERLFSVPAGHLYAFFGKNDHLKNNSLFSFFFYIELIEVTLVHKII